MEAGGTEITAVRLTGEVLEAIVGHARRELPNECCGLLVGTRDLIERAIPANNLRLGPTRYLIDPRDHFRALREARATDREVLGAYHSHPRGPDTPSPTDLSESHDPTLLHVIVSLERDEPVVRAYRLAEDEYTAVAIVAG